MTKLSIEPSANAHLDGLVTLVDADSALALAATIVTVAHLDGRWSRLKACPGDRRGWAFFDNSRNQASGWCSMQICGQRAKAPAYGRGEARRSRSS